MELYVRVERNILLDRELLQLRDKVSVDDKLVINIVKVNLDPHLDIVSKSNE